MAMEQDTGSGTEPGAQPRTPDQRAAALSAESAESVESAELAGSPGPERPAEDADAAAAGETASTGAGETASTGEPRVDAAIGPLTELDDLPVSEHPAVYERVHEQLVEVLGELHAGQAVQDGAVQGPAVRGPAGQGETQSEHA